MIALRLTAMRSGAAGWTAWSSLDPWRPPTWTASWAPGSSSIRSAMSNCTYITRAMHINIITGKSRYMKPGS